MSIPDNVKITIPWKSIADSPEIKNRAEHISARLEKELPSKHVLQGLKFRPVALRIDRDDVLVEIEGAMPLAVVHITWKKETDPRWPDTKLFQSWE